MSFNNMVTNKDKKIFAALIDKTRICLKSQAPGADPILCETAYLSKNQDFTYHTHPNGTPEPSDIDRRTTSKLGKKYLIIGLVPTKQVVVFQNNDGFQRLIASFQV